METRWCVWDHSIDSFAAITMSLSSPCKVPPLLDTGMVLENECLKVVPCPFMYRNPKSLEFNLVCLIIPRTERKKSRESNVKQSRYFYTKGSHALGGSYRNQEPSKQDFSLLHHLLCIFLHIYNYVKWTWTWTSFFICIRCVLLWLLNNNQMNLTGTFTEKLQLTFVSS